MKKNITYKQSLVKTKDNLPVWKESIDDKKNKIIYGEYNTMYKTILHV